MNALIAVVLVSLTSILGILLFPHKKKNNEKLISFLVSLAIGTMLATSFLELIPESIELLGHGAAYWMLGGFFVFFILEKFLWWHHHHNHDVHGCKKHPVGYVMLLGDALHNFVDGVLIAATFAIDTHLGIGTAIAIAMHEIPQEIGEFAILIKAGFSRTKAILWNLASATAALAGAGLVLLFDDAAFIKDFSYHFMAIAGASFLYIAAADLLPQLHNEKNNKKATIELLGIALGVLIIILMSGGHSH